MDGKCGDSEREPLDFFHHKLQDMSWAWFDNFTEVGQTNPVLVAALPSGGWILLNGHHRLVAAMLLGWDYLWAVEDSSRYDADLMWEHTDDGWQCRNVDLDETVWVEYSEVAE